MNGRQFWELYQSYGDVYLNEEVQIDEAREDEGLTKLQKIRKRNKSYFKNTPETVQKTTQRRGEHQASRGVKKKKELKVSLTL